MNIKKLTEYNLDQSGSEDKGPAEGKQFKSRLEFHFYLFASVNPKLIGLGFTGNPQRRFHHSAISSRPQQMTRRRRIVTRRKRIVTRRGKGTMGQTRSDEWIN